MAFLLAEKEAREKEKEEERIARIKERKEDMEQMKAMIQEGVKQEVQVAVVPLQERLDTQEKESKQLKDQFSEVLEEVKALRDSIKAKENFPPLPKNRSLKSFNTGDNIQFNSKGPGADHEHIKQVQDLCAGTS